MCNSKVIRSLSLLLFFSLLLTGFGSVNAKASTNLINSNFFQWDNITTSNSPTGEQLMNVALVGDNIYRLTPTYLSTTSSDMPVYMGWAIDLTSLRTGDSYTFEAYLPSPSEIRSLTGYNHTDEYFANWLGDGFSIGFGSVDENGNLVVILDFLNINKSNYLSLAGKRFVHSFECPDYTASNPGIYVWSYTGWSASQLFIEGSMSLVNNSDEDEESFLSNLGDIITGFFHDLKWDLIGGSCGDSECDKTPHSSLSARIGTSLSSLGDRISGFFNNLSGWLTNVMEGIQNRLTEVKEGIQSKIGEIQGWLTNLRIELINGIKGLFVPDEDYILVWKDNLDKLLQDHLGIIYTSANLVTDLVEKIFDIVFYAPESYGLTVPEVSFKILNGTQVKLIPETEISFDFMENKTFKTIYGLYTVGLYIAFGVLEVKYGTRVYKKVMAN